MTVLSTAHANLQRPFGIQVIINNVICIMQQMNTRTAFPFS